MINSIFKRLQGKKILVAGYGREGKSTLQFLQKHLSEAIIGVADKNESALKELDAQRFKLYYGDSYLDGISDYDIVIKTPGISLKDFDVDEKLISSQTDLFLEAYHNQVIGITGTKGKSTTSSLIYHLLKNNGRDVLLAGNIGIPVFDIIDKITPKSIIVYELSAHQLQYVHRSPHIGVLLNVFEEHLDHFGTFASYRSAKLNIMRYMTANDRAIINNKLSSEASDLGIPYVVFENYNFDDYNIDWEKLPLRGEHNILNIKAALCACYSFGVTIEELLPYLTTFKPLEHRQEFVGTYHGMTFYNDSISTIPQSAIAALKTIHNVDFLILGGYDRGIDYSLISKYLKKNPVPYLLLTGDVGKNIKKLLQDIDYKGKIFEFNCMEEAFDILHEVGKQGDICLLSPAAASYDQYKNFEERGIKFKNLARDF